MPDLAQSQVLRNLHGALQLLIRGAAQELTEQCNVSQPEADIMVFNALFNHLDKQVDLPTLLVGPVFQAIRISVEGAHADALLMEERAAIRARLEEGEQADTNVIKVKS